MKRPGSSDSFKDLHDGMEEVEYLEEEDDLCGNNGPSSGLGEKKRRLGAEQVRALEKNFEVENKLDPERKVRLAQDLGLQPRQVAVWFQNRRARWKTKQLERDFGALKARHDALKIDCDALRRDKEALLAEVEELKTKMADSGIVASDSEFKAAEEVIRASDSDSSAVFNDEASPYACLMGFNSHCSNSLSFPNKDDYKDCCYMGVEFMARDELCSSLYSEEQAPNLHWYSLDGWD